MFRYNIEQVPDIFCGYFKPIKTFMIITQEAVVVYMLDSLKLN